MRKGIAFILLAATAATPLAAQDWGNRGQDRGDRGQYQRRDDPRGTDQARPDRGPGDYRGSDRGGPDGRGFDGRGPDRRGPEGRGFDGRGPDGRDYRGQGGPDRRDWRDDRGGWRDGRGGRYERYNGYNGAWNNGWRNDRRYNWQGYRAQNRGLYRLPRYAAPRGYAYRRWSPGVRIDPFFYGQNYWISDPWQYRLPPAYGPYRWVRYYDDVALVDVRSGLIADIIYSFFW